MAPRPAYRPAPPPPAAPRSPAALGKSRTTYQRRRLLVRAGRRSPLPFRPTRCIAQSGFAFGRSYAAPCSSAPRGPDARPPVLAEVTRCGRSPLQLALHLWLRQPLRFRHSAFGGTMAPSQHAVPTAPGLNPAAGGCPCGRPTAPAARGRRAARRTPAWAKGSGLCGRRGWKIAPRRHRPTEPCIRRAGTGA